MSARVTATSHPRPEPWQLANKPLSIKRELLKQLFDTAEAANKLFRRRRLSPPTYTGLMA